jgi:hypothetical protein
MILGTRVLRMRRGMLQSPVYRFVHRASGHAVTVICTSHAGEARYFREVRDLACSLESGGAVVQFEAIRSATDDEWAAATSEERAARDMLNARPPGAGRDSPMMAALRGYLGWAFQLDALDYPASWVNADISSLELMRLAGSQHLLADTGNRDRALAVIGGEDGLARVGGPAAALILRAVTLDRWQLISRCVMRRGGDARAVDGAIGAARNDRAIGMLPAGRDAVMIWGAEHATGLCPGLRHAGYRQCRRVAWLDVGRLPGAWSSVRDLRATLTAAGRRLAEENDD